MSERPSALSRGHSSKSGRRVSIKAPVTRNEMPLLPDFAESPIDSSVSHINTTAVLTAPLSPATTRMAPVAPENVPRTPSRSPASPAINTSAVLSAPLSSAVSISTQEPVSRHTSESSEESAASEIIFSSPLGTPSVPTTITVSELAPPVVLPSTDRVLDVDLLLENHKYTVISRFEISDFGRVEYIKAISPLGDIVFIMLDQSGKLMVNRSDLTSVKTIEGSKIAVSNRLAASECTSTVTCGVALQCADELCTIVRKDDGQTDQRSFVITESYAPRTISPAGSALSYPILRLSEIQHDPGRAALRAADASKRIYDNAFVTMNADFDFTLLEIQKINAVTTDFSTTRIAVARKYTEDIVKLQRLANSHYEHYSRGGRSEKNAGTYTSVRINLYARSRALGDVIAVTNAFNQLKSELTLMRGRIQALTDILMSDHNNIADKVLTADEAFAMGHR